MVNSTCIRVLEYDKILKLLADCTQTNLGKELALKLQPECVTATVHELLQQTQEAVDMLALERDIPISSTRDISTILQRLKIGAIADPSELLAVYNTLLAVSRVKAYLNVEYEQIDILKNFATELIPFPSIELSIERAIADNGTLKDNASNELASIRTRVSIFKNRIKERLESILRSSEYQKYFQEQIVTIRNDRYVIPIKQEYRQYFPGVVHDQSSSGATVFIEPLSVVNINNDIKKLALDEEQEIERILRKLSADILRIHTELADNLRILTELDLIFAKARLALRMSATLPEVGEHTGINILQGRHPLISKEQVVALDILMDKELRTLIITGPNTGGKTVSLKLLGLFVLMAQAGMFIPASAHSSLPLYKNVFADIGDEQSIEQSLSTFSGHMTNIINILEHVNDRSLVLLDEICAGTDPSEGSALAIAILLYLQDKGATTFTTTHYNELKLFAIKHPGMINASVEFDKISLSPKYRLIMGIAGSSNAFYISKRLGLSEEIISSAQTFIDQEQVKFNNILQDLEAEKVSFALTNREMKEAQEKIRRLQFQLESDKQALKRREEAILQKARQEADDIKRRGKREVEAVIEQLRQLEKEQNGQAKHAKIKQAREALSNDWIIAKPEDETGSVVTIDNAKLGMPVFITTLGQKGTILEIKGQDLQVQVGSLKTYVKMSKCLTTKASKIQNEKNKMRTVSTKELAKARGFRPEIDIRGYNVQEAVAELDKYIDDAVMLNVSQLRIIHGKGTGMLKKGIEEYLSTHSLVKSFEEAAANEGGAGATIIYL